MDNQLSGQSSAQSGCWLLNETTLSLEVVILLIGGMTLLITGVILFPVSSGAVSYYENGLYGLLLIIFALQIITIGRMPFGDVRRSKAVLAAGIMIAAAGIVTCCIPVTTQLSRVLLILCFGPGGIVLLLQMLIAPNKLRAWLRYGGVFRNLIFGCFGVYAMSMLIAILLWKKIPLTTPVTAVAVTVFGIVTIFLALALQKIFNNYPEAEKHPGHYPDLSADQVMLMLMGVFILLIGIMLVPVNLGIVSFSASAQLGLLMVIFAVQMLASGSTPVGSFPRSWLMIAAGLLFAGAGIVSCIIPGILVTPLTVLVGTINILSGTIALSKTGFTPPRQTPELSGNAYHLIARLFAVQLTMNLLAVIFGASMLMHGLIPGLLIGIILTANGCVILYLVRILVVLDKMRCDQPEDV